MTTHKATTKGRVQGGFNRSEYYNKIEMEFDRKFEYNRGLTEQYEHKNALKNGTPEQRLEAQKREIEYKEAILFEKQAQEQKQAQQQTNIQTQIQTQMKADNEQQQEQQAQDQAQQRTEQQAHKLTLEERIEARREYYRKEGFPEQGIENMIQMELKYKMFDRPARTEEQEREKKLEELRKKEQEQEKKIEEKRNKDKGLSR